MKTRIIQTRFWEDDSVDTCSLYGQHLWIYLLTCPFINMGGIFKLKDLIISDQAKLDTKHLNQAKRELEATGKVFFYKSWIYVVNALKQNNYVNSPKNCSAYEREVSQIPTEVRQYFETVTKANDTSISTSISTSIDTNHKSKIINHKSEEVKLFLKKFNEVYQTNYTSPKSFINNFKTWREEYSLEQILEAIEKSKLSDFWHDKLTPEKLLRTNADRIGEFLNIKATLPKFEDLDTPEGVDERLRIYKIYQGRRVYANTAQSKGY